MEEDKDSRSRSVPGPCAYAGRDTTKGSSVELHGIPKGKEQSNDLREVPGTAVQVRNREFWCCGYYVDTAGKNARKIEEYIRHQLDEDKAGEQLTMGNF